MRRTIACVARFLVGSFVIVPCASEMAWSSMSTSTHPIGVIADGEPASELARREWALGCAAVLTERNYDSHVLLGGCHLGDGDRTDKRELLSDAWGIENRDDLLATLDSLAEEGHRAVFDRVGSLVATLSQSQYEALIHTESDPEVVNRVSIARRYHSELGPKSLYGWDFSRAICLCRWAYAAGYIEEGEAWRRIMPMAILLQKKFDSWEDLGRNYLIGRRFWSLEETQEHGWRYEDAFLRLLDMRSSPWNKYRWEMRLTDEPDDEIQPKERRELEMKNRIETMGPFAALQ